MRCLMGVDAFDIIAVMLGIFFTIRKLDAQSRQPEDFPGVENRAFLSWRKREVGVYVVAVWACFLKVFIDLGFTHLIAGHMRPSFIRLVGAAIDLGWLAVVIVSLVRATSVRKERQRLGIVLGAPAPAPRPDKNDENDPLRR